jgi:hypothetical protein
MPRIVLNFLKAQAYHIAAEIRGSCTQFLNGILEVGKNSLALVVKSDDSFT